MPYLVNYFTRQDGARRLATPSFMTREAASYYFTQQRIPFEIIILKQQIDFALQLTDPIQAAQYLAKLAARLEKLEALTKQKK